MASDDRLWAEQLLAAGTQLLQMALTPSDTPEPAPLSLALVALKQGMAELELAQQEEIEAERISYVYVEAMEHIEESNTSRRCSLLRTGEFDETSRSCTSEPLCFPIHESLSFVC